MKKIMVFGLGVSGLSVCRHLTRKGIDFVATDDKMNIAEIAPFTSHLKSVQECMEMLSAAFTIIVSPGIPKSHPLLALALEMGVEVIGEVELAAREIKAPKMVIGVTGTNGKTTVTMLLNHILTIAGHSSLAVGNIGTPLLDVVEEAGPFVVEVSSYQLETMSTEVFHSGVILNVTPDHLDHHGSIEAYTEAKMRLLGCLKKDRKHSFYVHESVAPKNARSYGFKKTSDVWSDGTYIYRFGERESELPDIFKGIFSHDVENFIGAYAVARDCDVPAKVCVEAYSSFIKPPHRIQFVRTVDGVSYYDDSKGTNVDAVVRAVESLPGNGKIILVAGGVHKGESYASWNCRFQGRVQHVFAIGAAAPLIEADLRAEVPVSIESTLERAVHSAREIAKTGDNVLLSPGCSSFDMFKNYKERGEKFQAVVQSL